MSVLDRTLRITIFPNLSGMTCAELDISLRMFCDYLTRPTAAATKQGLPLFSLCRFGDQRSTKGSLRHRANVLSVDGIVLDHDDGTLSIEDARLVLHDSGVPGVILSTSRYTPELPKWRALLPLSQTCAADQYASLVCRVAGLFPPHVQFDVKSWEVSQSYYFGALVGKKVILQ